MAQPLVSVIIPTYNGNAYLEEALQSVFSQTYTHYEVIVVDDGSTTDASRKICEKYRDRVKYILRENGGDGPARNTAMQVARGDYWAFLDDDDLWMPEKLEEQVRLYEDLKGRGVKPGLLYTGMTVIDEKGLELHKGLYSSSGNNFEKILFFDFVGTPSSVMTCRPVLEDVGYFDESFKRRKDYELWVRVARKYPVYSVDRYLVKYRQRAAQFSKDPGMMVEGLHNIFKKVFAADPDMDSVKRKMLELRIKKESARRFKHVAYHRYFVMNDAVTFRKYFREGAAYDPSQFGISAWSYYYGSFIFPKLGPLIHKLRRPAPLTDVFVDVNAVDLKDWIKKNLSISS